MKRPLFIFICTSVFCLALFVGSFIVLRQRHWCPALKGTEVWRGNERLSDASVYQCKDDYFVVWAERYSISAIQPKSRKFGYVNQSDFVKYAGGLISWDYPIHPQLGDTIHPDAADAAEEPELVITPEYFEYKSADRRIKVILARQQSLTLKTNAR